MSTLKNKNDELILMIVSSLGIVEDLKQQFNSNLGNKRSSLNKIDSLLRNLIEIEKQTQEIKALTYRFADPNTELFNGEGKTTFRDKNHKLGNKITGALYATEFLKELIEADGDEKNNIILGLNTLYKAIKETENQAQEVQKLAFRFVDSEMDLFKMESTIKDENRKIKILVVEDDAIVSHFSKQILERRGFNIFIASEVGTAVKVIKENSPDIVILDLALPLHLEGLEILRFIKDHKLPIKCIVVTKLDDVEDLVIVNSLGPERILTKPTSPDQLLAQINSFSRKNNG